MTFVRASGPGGQNVNKVSTAVQLRFDVGQSRSLPADVRQRLLALAGNRATQDGVLIITSRVHRTQEANRAEARARLNELIARAQVVPKTRPPQSAHARAPRSVGSRQNRNGPPPRKLRGRAKRRTDLAHPFSRCSVEDYPEDRRSRRIIANPVPRSIIDDGSGVTTALGGPAPAMPGLYTIVCPEWMPRRIERKGWVHKSLCAEIGIHRVHDRVVLSRIHLGGKSHVIHLVQKFKVWRGIEVLTEAHLQMGLRWLETC